MAVYKVTVDEATTVLGVTEAVTILSEQVTGIQGPTGQGLATGGTTNQVLAKNSSTNFDTKWIDAGGGGGSGTVTSVGTGTGLTGGPITTAGTLSLADLSPAPTGTYGTATAVPTITVDVKGRTTAVASTPIQLASASAVTGLTTTLAGKANTGTTNTFTNSQTIQGSLTCDNGSGSMIFDSGTGNLTLDTGSLTVLNTILASGTISGLQLISTGFIKLGAANKVATIDASALSANRQIAIPDKDFKIVGIDSSGVNNDILSLTGLTTPLSTSQGGTGATGASTGTGGVVLKTSPTITTPTITTPAVTNGTFDTPTITTPAVTNGTFATPTITTPTVSNGVFTRPTFTRTIYQNSAPTTLTWTSNASTISSGVLTSGWMRITSANLTATGTLSLPSTSICAAFLTTNGEAADVIIVNEASFAATATGVSGVTLTGNTSIAANSSATFRFYRTSSTVFVWVRTA
jgi:hypothetical protein